MLHKTDMPSKPVQMCHNTHLHTAPLVQMCPCYTRDLNCMPSLLSRTCATFPDKNNVNELLLCMQSSCKDANDC